MQTELIDTIELEDTPIAYPLDAPELETLTRCEAVIARGVQTFIEVGEALAEIREKRLYRAGFATFESYCRDKWAIGGSRARQLIGASGVARQIERVTTVTLSSETHARPLVGMGPDQQVQAAQRAASIAGDKAPTAKHFQQAAAEIRAPAPDLADMLLRLDAHGYAKSGARQKGTTTFYSFRDYSGASDETGGELELAEGELPSWLADLDYYAQRAQERQAQFLDMQARFAVFGWDLRRDGKEFGLYKPNGGHVGTWKILDQHMRQLKELERSRANRIVRGDPAYADVLPAPPSEDDQHRQAIEYILTQPHTPAAMQQAYDRAAEIHDLTLHNKMIALIDRATDAPIHQPPAPTLTELDTNRMPDDLHRAGYYWHSATPPTIAHDSGWRGDAPTVDQALACARDREKAKAAPQMIALPPFPAADLPALMESISFLLEMTVKWVPSSREKAAPALGLLKAIGRKALEATE